MGKIDYTKPTRTDDGLGFEYAPDHFSREATSRPMSALAAVLGMVTPALIAVVGILVIALVGCKSDAKPAPKPGEIAKAGAVVAPHSHTGDCKRVAAADRALCRTVYRQHAYGVVNGTSEWSAPAGPAIVHDVTHQGLTKSEMHSYLTGEAAEYRRNVTAVQVNMDKLKNSDCRWVIGFKDEDGKPGGRKLTQVRQSCP